MSDFSGSSWQTSNPPMPGWYSVTVKNTCGDRLTTMAYYWGAEGASCLLDWTMLPKNEELEVLAWQPLPEPYQGEGKA
jgi:hypothetical protein